MKCSWGKPAVTGKGRLFRSVFSSALRGRKDIRKGLKKRRENTSVKRPEGRQKREGRGKPVLLTKELWSTLDEKKREKTTVISRGR